MNKLNRLDFTKKIWFSEKFENYYWKSRIQWIVYKKIMWNQIVKNPQIFRLCNYIIKIKTFITIIIKNRINKIDEERLSSMNSRNNLLTNAKTCGKIDGHCVFSPTIYIWFLFFSYWFVWHSWAEVTIFGQSKCSSLSHYIYWMPLVSYT